MGYHRISRIKLTGNAVRAYFVDLGRAFAGHGYSEGYEHGYVDAEADAAE